MFKKDCLNEIFSCSSVLSGQIFLKGKVTLEARWAGAGVPGCHRHAGGGVLTGVQAANVKVRLELAVTAVEAGLALAGVAVVVSVRLQKAQLSLVCRKKTGTGSTLL